MPSYKIVVDDGTKVCPVLINGKYYEAKFKSRFSRYKGHYVHNRYVEKRKALQIRSPI